MTISNTNVKQIYQGNGTTTVFAIPFTFTSNSEIFVTLRDETSSSAITETLQTINTHYTLTGGTPPTTVTMVTPPASDEKLIIYRSNPLTQTADYLDTGPFPAETHESVLDKVVKQIQELQEQINRCIKAPIGSPVTNVGNGKQPVQGYFLRWDATNPIPTDIEYVATPTGSVVLPLTTKGDIFTYSTANARLPVGSNNQVLVADSAQATGLKWANASSGGGGSINWVEAAIAPISSISNNLQIYSFQQTLGQAVYAVIRVPNSYNAGSQINLRFVWNSSDNTGNVLMSTLTTLIKPGTDAISSTTNQRTSTNATVSLGAGTVNKPQSVAADLTSSTGTINSVAVAAGDLLIVKLFRDTSDTSTVDVDVPVYACEVTFV